jgi:hypothetical protein
VHFWGGVEVVPYGFLDDREQQIFDLFRGKKNLSANGEGSCYLGGMVWQNLMRNFVMRRYTASDHSNQSGPS